MSGLLVLAQRLHGSGPGSRSCADGQHGVAGARRPCRGRHRVLARCSRRVEHHVVRRLAARGREEAVDRGGALVGVVALDHRGLVAARAGRRRRRSGSPGRPSTGPSPSGSSRSSVSSVTAGRSSPSESRIGAPIGVPASTEAATPPASRPCPRARRRSGGRCRSWREDRAATPAASRRGVAAAHADRVARGGGGEAELLRGLLVVGLHAELGRRGRRRRRCYSRTGSSGDKRGGAAERRAIRGAR